MPNGGRNRDGGHHSKTYRTRTRNDQDEAVARDPDIRGVMKRDSKTGRERDTRKGRD
jgi:hypothetical protein